ncbi:MAG: IS4 family transposase [Myxococcales bacterium]|nr:IS4 family transposase [Myxococcales bacterium]
MARARASQIVATIASVLPPARVIELARELGVVKRQRKVDIVHFVQALVLGFSLDRVRSLSGLRRAYQLLAGATLARSSFHGRFTAELVQLMRQLADEALGKTTGAKEKLRKAFKPFADVLAIDSCIIRLHAGLAKHYPSVWTHHTPASAKLTMVCNVVGRGPRTLQISPGSTHDVHLLKPGGWVRGKLLIFDLGFYRAMLFKSIAEHDGYFLCRLKKQGNPTIVKSHRPDHAHLVNKKLRDCQHAIADDVIDVEGEVSYVLRRKKITHHTAQFRIVAIYNHELGLWHRYITNAPPEMMPAESITAIYAGRWEIELLFRELKSAYRIHEMPSGNRYASETLLYSAILTLLVSRRLHRLVRTIAELDWLDSRLIGGRGSWPA